MEGILGEMIPLVAVILSLGLPIVVVVMVLIAKMNKEKQQKELRQLIIENKTDPETAKLLIDEPKKQKRELGPFNLENLRAACILLGLGFGALIDWISCIETKSIYFWLIIASGIGIGLLCSFLIEMRLFKKYGKQLTNPSAEPNDKE
jgi:F0F1-type ATP synthase assembly protein I